MLYSILKLSQFAVKFPFGIFPFYYSLGDCNILAWTLDSCMNTESSSLRELVQKQILEICISANSKAKKGGGSDKIKTKLIIFTQIILLLMHLKIYLRIMLSTSIKLINFKNTYYAFTWICYICYIFNVQIGLKFYILIPAEFLEEPIYSVYW